MTQQFQRVALGQGIHFSSVSDSKFKHNRISVNFITPLKEETAAQNAILPFLLRRGCKSCPDYTALEQRLSRLYGASLSADVMKFGPYQMLGVSIQSIDDRFALEGEAISRDCARLLADIAFDPLISAGSFDEQATALEREFLMDTIAAEINDKRSYAVSRCKQEMCPGEPAALCKYGTEATARAVTARTAAAAYRALADSAAIEILFVGSGRPDAALAIFQELFAGLRREEIPPYALLPRKSAGKAPKEKTEELDISQSKLVLGMRVGGQAPDYAAHRPLRMMAALYGGTPFSRLFVNVREKLSLCYYCAARYDMGSGLLMVDSGVEAPNRQRACDEILAQLKVMQEGGFTDEELRSTRLAVRGSLAATGDSLGALESWYLSQILMNSAISPEQDAGAMSEITREEIVEAAGLVGLDTVYFLTGKGGDRA